MNASIIMRSQLVFLRTFNFLLVNRGLAQNLAEQDPAETEVWEPVPKVVTPGDKRKSPSGAVILFGGDDRLRGVILGSGSLLS